MQEPFHDYGKIDRLRRAMYSRSLSGKLKDRPRREMDQGEANVGEDWEKEAPKVKRSFIPAVRMDQIRSLLHWLLLVGVVFFIGAAGFFAYYFLLGSGSSPTPPSIAISGPPTVAGGEVTELQVVVTNRNRATLELADLIITFPPGTRISQTLSSDVTTRRISLGTIAPSEIRQVPVRAVFVGAEGNQANMHVELEYRLKGSSAIFVASSDHTIVFNSSPVSVSIEGNTETVSGQQIALTLTVASNAPAPTKDVLLSLSFPFGFKYASAEPQAKTPGVWELGEIRPGDRVRITVRGTLSGESGDERVFRAAVGTRKSTESPNIDTVLAENAHRMAISQPFLSLAVAVNRESGSNVIVAPGGTASIVISWKNNLDAAITDAIIVARLSGIAVDGETVRTNDGFYRSSDTAILWDKSTTQGVFANLAPGSSGTVNFAFSMPESNALIGLRDPRLTITVNAAGKRLSETGVPGNLQATAVQTIKLASDLDFIARGLYYDNPFGSTGPMPPKAGNETSYAILFGITNTTNKIKNAKVTASLPAYVRSMGMFLARSEDVTFNNTDGTITWRVGDIESGAGIDGSPARQMAFAIGFTPSTSQIGEEPVLLRDIKLTGLDEATGAAVTKTLRDITTNIAGDRGFSQSDATVVR